MPVKYRCIDCGVTYPITGMRNVVGKVVCNNCANLYCEICGRKRNYPTAPEKPLCKNCSGFHSKLLREDTLQVPVTNLKAQAYICSFCQKTVPLFSESGKQLIKVFLYTVPAIGYTQGYTGYMTACNTCYLRHEIISKKESPPITPPVPPRTARPEPFWYVGKTGSAKASWLDTFRASAGFVTQVIDLAKGGEKILNIDDWQLGEDFKNAVEDADVETLVRMAQRIVGNMDKTAESRRLIVVLGAIEDALEEDDE